MDLIICVVLAILIFVCFAIGYKEGLRLGMRCAKGIEPKPMKNPVMAIKEAVHEHKEQEKSEEQARIYDEFEAFDGYTEQEREWMRGGSRK